MKKTQFHTKKIERYLLGIVLILFFQSCNRNPLEENLQKSGTNRQELEKVLEHYKDDELKLKAARFLIENMDAHFSLHHEHYDAFYRDIDSLYVNHKGSVINLIYFNFINLRRSMI